MLQNIRGCSDKNYIKWVENTDEVVERVQCFNIKNPNELTSNVWMTVVL